MPAASADELAAAARRVRLRDLDIVSNAGMGHIGGEFSVTDILVTLYLAVVDQGDGSERDLAQTRVGGAPAVRSGDGLQKEVIAPRRARPAAHSLPLARLAR